MTLNLRQKLHITQKPFWNNIWTNIAWLYVDTYGWTNWICSRAFSYLIQMTTVSAIWPKPVTSCSLRCFAHSDLLRVNAKKTESPTRVKQFVRLAVYLWLDILQWEHHSVQCLSVLNFWSLHYLQHTEISSHILIYCDAAQTINWTNLRKKPEAKRCLPTRYRPQCDPQNRNHHQLY